jgi:hypothetical protein
VKNNQCAVPGERFPLPRVQDCYDRANHCLDMWNCRPRRAVIPEWRMRGRSWRFESDNNKLNSREISTLTGIREGQQNHEPRPSMSDIGRAVPEWPCTTKCRRTVHRQPGAQNGVM